MAMIDDVASYLATQLSLTVGTDLFKGFMDDTPDAQGVVYETGGVAPNMGFGATTPNYRTPGIQVVFRGDPNDYVGPRALAEAAFLALAAVQASTIGSTFFHWIHPTQEPFVLARDANERVKIVFNCLCERD